MNHKSWTTYTCSYCNYTIRLRNISLNLWISCSRLCVSNTSYCMLMFWSWEASPTFINFCRRWLIGLIYSWLYWNILSVGECKKHLYYFASHVTLWFVFGHNFCILTPMDLRFLGKVLMTIIQLPWFFGNFQKYSTIQK